MGNVDDYIIDELFKLKHRVKVLEAKQEKKENEEIEWALNQFRYKEKTVDESKAFAIIEKAIGKKKTKLRAKPVR